MSEFYGEVADVVQGPHAVPQDFQVIGDPGQFVEKRPHVFFDNGRLASGPLPELRRLLDAVAAGFYDVVILPGPFVLSMDDAKAQAIVRQITDHGCRVIELPSRQATTEAPSSRRPTHPAHL